MTAEAGVGLTLHVFLDEDDDLAMALIPARLGKLSVREAEAHELFHGDLSDGTPEMVATLVERLAELVPVDCEDGGVVVDAAALVRALREGAELS